MKTINSHQATLQRKIAEREALLIRSREIGRQLIALGDDIRQIKEGKEREDLWNTTR